jgi:hypothetical protein
LFYFRPAPESGTGRIRTSWLLLVLSVVSPPPNNGEKKGFYLRTVLPAAGLGIAHASKTQTRKRVKSVTWANYPFSNQQDSTPKDTPKSVEGGNGTGDSIGSKSRGHSSSHTLYNHLLSLNIYHKSNYNYYILKLKVYINR